jgi:hypothetical protein
MSKPHDDGIIIGSERFWNMAFWAAIAACEAVGLLLARS